MGAAAAPLAVNATVTTAAAVARHTPCVLLPQQPPVPRLPPVPVPVPVPVPPPVPVPLLLLPPVPVLLPLLPPEPAAHVW